MNNLRVAAYAIAKDEAKHVDAFVNALSEADGIFVTDTGSTDETVSLLQARGVHVQNKTYENFRMDVARNDSLDFVPHEFDVVVVVDLDETFRKGWRADVEANWKDGVTTLWHPIITSFQADGVTPKTCFDGNRVHSRIGYRWKFPCHERHVWQGQGQEIPGRMETALEHHPDNNKSRVQYLSLLELFATEEPESDRAAYYLAREYYFRGWYLKAEEHFKRHILLKCSLWNIERSSSMRYLAAIERSRGNNQQQLLWLMRACAEAPEWRDPWVELSQAYADVNDWAGCHYGATRAMTIHVKVSHVHSSEKVWTKWPEFLLKLSQVHLGMAL